MHWLHSRYAKIVLVFHPEVSYSLSMMNETSNAMNLSDALADLKCEVASGLAAEDVYEEVAAEFSVHPKLLLRKFREVYPTDEAYRAVAPRNLNSVIAEKVEQSIAAMCKKYDVTVSGVTRAKIGGKTVRVICRSGSKLIVVDEHTAKCLSFTNWQYNIKRI